MKDPGDPLARYHRQMLLPAFGRDAQHRLANRTALVVGCGALGTVALDLLARAGVGTLIFIDRDLVELTNLQRQSLFDEASAHASTPKAVAAAERLRAINSSIRLLPIVADVSSANIERLVDEAAARRWSAASASSDTQAQPRDEEPAHLARLVNVVLDCTDNFQTRYLLNDVCVKHHIPLIYAGAVATSGMTMSIIPGSSPCLRCVFPTPPAPGSFPTCDTAGVLAPASGAIANLQAAEALKVLLAESGAISRSLREIDVWNASLRSIDLSNARDPDCPCCAKHAFEFLDAPAQSTVSICGSNSVQVWPRSAAIDLPALHTRLTPHGSFTCSRFVLRGRLTSEHIDVAIFPDARALFTGTSDPAHARSLYTRYIGD